MGRSSSRQYDGRPAATISNIFSIVSLPLSVNLLAVESFTVNIYALRDNQYRRTKEVRITKENLTG